MTKAVPNRQIAEEAAEWAVRLDSGPLAGDEREALAGWLRASPMHVDELLLATSILGGLEGIDRARAVSVDDLLAQATPEVVPLFEAPGAAGGDEGRPAQRPRALWRLAGPPRWWAVAAALALVVVTAVVLSPSPSDESGPALAEAGALATVFTTALGEQRSITLTDGSVVFLNARSSMRVRMTGRQREIDLLHGEALFEVAHDADRPFRVYAAGAVAQALGTKFNVRHTADGIQVAVVEGQVLVDSRATPAGRAASAPPPARMEGRLLAPDQVILAVGQQVELHRHGATPLIADADLVAVTSWRMRQLSFDDAGLGEIVAEFNRYNRTPIVLAEPSLDSMRLSGVFDANDPGSFIDFLELSTSVEVDRSSRPGQIVLRRKDS